jgi:hypothetical protein
MISCWYFLPELGYGIGTTESADPGNGLGKESWS